MTRKYTEGSYILHKCVFCNRLMISNMWPKDKFMSKIIHLECRLLHQGKIMRVRNRATCQ